METTRLIRRPWEIIDITVDNDNRAVEVYMDNGQDVRVLRHQVATQKELEDWLVDATMRMVLYGFKQAWAKG